MILRNREAEALGMQALFYDRPCPAQGCQYHAARDGAWLVCAGGHRMKARLR